MEFLEIKICKPALMTSPAIKPTHLISLNIYIFMCMGVLPRCMSVYHLCAVSIEGWRKLGLELQLGAIWVLGMESGCSYHWVFSPFVALLIPDLPHLSGVLLIFPFFPKEGSFSALFSYYVNCVCLMGSQYMKLVNSWGWQEDRTRSLVRVTDFHKSLAQSWI